MRIEKIVLHCSMTSCYCALDRVARHYCTLASCTTRLYLSEIHSNTVPYRGTSAPLFLYILLTTLARTGKPGKGEPRRRHSQRGPRSGGYSTPAPSPRSETPVVCSSSIGDRVTVWTTSQQVTPSPCSIAKLTWRYSTRHDLRN